MAIALDTHILPRCRWCDEHIFIVQLWMGHDSLMIGPILDSHGNQILKRASSTYTAVGLHDVDAPVSASHGLAIISVEANEGGFVKGGVDVAFGNHSFLHCWSPGKGSCYHTISIGDNTLPKGCRTWMLSLIIVVVEFQFWSFIDANNVWRDFHDFSFCP